MQALRVFPDSRNAGLPDLYFGGTHLESQDEARERGHGDPKTTIKGEVAAFSVLASGNSAGR